MSAMPPQGDGREQIPLSDEDLAFLTAPIPLPDAKAWRALIIELRRQAILSRHPRRAGSLPVGFEGAAEAVTACERLVRASTGDARVSEPLRALSIAMWSMPDRGRPEMFAFNHGRGAPPVDPKTALLQAMAARAVSELMTAGEGRLEAAARVERASRGKMRLEQILKRREKLEEGHGGDASPYAVDMYRRPLPPEAGDKPRARAEFLLAWIGNQKQISRKSPG